MSKGLALALVLVFLTALCTIMMQPVKADSQSPQLQWSKTYTANEAYALTQTRDGGFAIAGVNATFSAQSRGYVDYLPVLIKTNVEGIVEWEKTYTNESGEASTVFQTADSGYFISGNNWLLKTDAQGNVQWSQDTEISLKGAESTQTNDGLYIMVGNTPNTVTSYDYTVLLKYNANGVFQWQRNYTGNIYWSDAAAIIATNDNNYAFAGNTYGSFWFVKVDTNGNILWDRTYTFDNIAQVSPPTFYSIAQTKDGGYILAGGDGYYGWLVKTDSQGNEQWHLRCDFGGFTSVVQTSDGGYVAFSDTELVKVDNSGNLQWSEFYNKSDNLTASSYGPPYNANAGIITKDGSLAVVGSVNPQGTSESYFWAAKFAPESVVSSSEFFTTAAVATVSAAIVILTSVIASLLLYRRHRKTANQKQVTYRKLKT